MNYRSWVGALALCTCLSQPLPALAQSFGAGQAPKDIQLKLLGTAIPVSDLDRSVAFYSKGLGLTATPRRDMNDTVEEPMIFAGGGPYLILLWSKTPSAASSPPPATQRIILDVPDLKALEARLKANGYPLRTPITTHSPQIAVAQLDDPDGNHLELVQRAPPP